MLSRFLLVVMISMSHTYKPGINKTVQKMCIHIEIRWIKLQYPWMQGEKLYLVHRRS